MLKKRNGSPLHSLDIRLRYQFFRYSCVVLAGIF